MFDHEQSLLARAHQTWMGSAACRGRTTVFFPPHAERPQARVRREAKARTICSTCPALAECRAFAYEQHEQGFWGGQSQEERDLAQHHSFRSIGR